MPRAWLKSPLFARLDGAAAKLRKEVIEQRTAALEGSDESTLPLATQPAKRKRCEQGEQGGCRLT